MRIVNGNVPHARRLAETGAALSRAARVRLAWMDFYRSHGQNAALTCRHFGISRQTFYRWKRRYDPDRPASLEARGRKPRSYASPPGDGSSPSRCSTSGSGTPGGARTSWPFCSAARAGPSLLRWWGASSPS